MACKTSINPLINIVVALFIAKHLWYRILCCLITDPATVGYLVWQVYQGIYRDSAVLTTDSLKTEKLNSKGMLLKLFLGWRPVTSNIVTCLNGLEMLFWLLMIMFIRWCTWSVVLVCLRPYLPIHVQKKCNCLRAHSDWLNRKHDWQISVIKTKTNTWCMLYHQHLIFSIFQK